MTWLIIAVCSKVPGMFEVKIIVITIKFTDSIFEGWHVVGFRRKEGGKTFHKLYALGMNDDLLDNVRG